MALKLIYNLTFRALQTFAAMQNEAGGFGSGHGQMSHCAPSYATVLSLAMIGGSNAMDLIDRRALYVALLSNSKTMLRTSPRWKWLGNLKQPDGGFTVCEGGEEDVRYNYKYKHYYQMANPYSGAYTAMVMISLLGLPLELPQESSARAAGMSSFLDKLPQWLSRCTMASSPRIYYS